MVTSADRPTDFTINMALPFWNTMLLMGTDGTITNPTQQSPNPGFHGSDGLYFWEGGNHMAGQDDKAVQLS
jgi:hypothetical protein